MKILVTGSNGQLGSEIRCLESEYPKYKFTFTDLNSLDITSNCDLQLFFKDKSFDALINCAAYTNVDKAEDDIESAYKVNFEAVKYLSEICRQKKISMVHISTDYVFDGNKVDAYDENDFTNPESIYGKSKLEGEKIMKKINPMNSIIIRTSWVFSKFGKNFVKTILRLISEKEEFGVVSDQFGSPTNAAHLAKDIIRIIPKLKNKNVETFHYSNQGYCSWYDFALEILSYSKKKSKVKPIKTKNYITKAKRPFHSSLNSSKFITKFDIIIPEWKTALNQIDFDKINLN